MRGERVSVRPANESDSRPVLLEHLNSSGHDDAVFAAVHILAMTGVDFFLVHRAQGRSGVAGVEEADTECRVSVEDDFAVLSPADQSRLLIAEQLSTVILAHVPQE